MTEKQRMLAGHPYFSRDGELISMYHRARKLLQTYNHLDSTKIKSRNKILSELFAFKGENIWIEAPFYCDYGEFIHIGKNSFVNTNCIFLDNNKITIGENALIGPFVQIYTAGHPLIASDRIRTLNDAQQSRTYLTASKPVSIGDNVWIGGNTVIMPGVSIGNNVTIGASSLVTKNIPDNVLAFGNPCKVIKKL